MPWTVTAWARSDFKDSGSGSLSQTILALGDPAEACMGIHLGVQPDNHLALKSDCQTFYQTSGDWVNQWRHLAAVYDGRGLYLYLDGQMVYFATVSGLQVAGPALAVGSDGGAADFDGAIDHLRIYRGVLDWQAIGTQAQEFSGP